MKKIILNLALATMALTTIACGTNENTTKITKGNKSKMDTISYAYGVVVGEQYNSESRMIKELDVDMKTVWESFNNAVTGNLVIVGKDTITEENMEKIYRKAFNRDFQSRIIAARNDSTGKTKVHNTAAERELVSAFVGTDIGLGLIRMDVPMQLYWIEKGKEDIANGTATMTPAQADGYIRNYMMQAELAKIEEASKASIEWLAKVEKEKGVKKTASGLLYKIEREGDMSAKPTSLADVVTVHYEGTTRDGKVFDSSYKRGQTIDFPLNGVIKGWGEGLQLVGKGGKIILWIPSELAYGKRGAGAAIGPNEALRFVVELIDVAPAAK